ncbi:MAG: hypothetical protein HY717_15485 [Planctomycetes bacterium]|nr:hypothetical protein [Planctomycetota bacterium]
MENFTFLIREHLFNLVGDRNCISLVASQDILDDDPVRINDTFFSGGEVFLGFLGPVGIPQDVLDEAKGVAIDTAIQGAVLNPAKFPPLRIARSDYRDRSSTALPQFYEPAFSHLQSDNLNPEKFSILDGRGVARKIKRKMGCGWNLKPAI